MFDANRAIARTLLPTALGASLGNLVERFLGEGLDSRMDAWKLWVTQMGLTGLVVAAMKDACFADNHAITFFTTYYIDMQPSLHKRTLRLFTTNK